jgi:hypothetical protein
MAMDISSLILGHSRLLLTRAAEKRIPMIDSAGKCSWLMQFNAGYQITKRVSDQKVFFFGGSTLYLEA